MDLEDKLVTAAITTLANKMLGPFVDQVLTLSKEAINQYRYRNVLTVLDLGTRMLNEAEIDPEPVPGKILLPLLEAASFDDNDGMQKMWAALLANAALGTSSAQSYLTGFVESLKRMSPEQALILEYLRLGDTDYSQLQRKFSHLDLRSTNPPDALPPKYQAPLAVHLDGLLADVLIDKNPNTYQLTSRGHAFLNAVTPPQPRQ